MSGCQTREENAADLAHEASRHLVEYHALVQEIVVRKMRVVCWSDEDPNDTAEVMDPNADDILHEESRGRTVMNVYEIGPWNLPALEARHQAKLAAQEKAE